MENCRVLECEECLQEFSCEKREVIVEGQVGVSREVFKGLEFVRRSGRYNMFEYHSVMAMAYENEFFETAVWMSENKKIYIQGIFRGFKVGDKVE